MASVCISVFLFSPIQCMCHVLLFSACHEYIVKFLFPATTIHVDRNISLSSLFSCLHYQEHLVPVSVIIHLTFFPLLYLNRNTSLFPVPAKSTWPSKAYIYIPNPCYPCNSISAPVMCSDICFLSLVCILNLYGVFQYLWIVPLKYIIVNCTDYKHWLIYIYIFTNIYSRTSVYRGHVTDHRCCDNLSCMCRNIASKSNYYWLSINNTLSCFIAIPLVMWVSFWLAKTLNTWLIIMI